MPLRDYYAILELPFNAPDNEVKAAYDALSKKHRLDRIGDIKVYDAGFMEICEAYEKLRYPLVKAAYISQYMKEQASGWQSALIINRPRITNTDSWSEITPGKSAPLPRPQREECMPPPPTQKESEPPLTGMAKFIVNVLFVLEFGYGIFCVFVVYAMYQSCNAR